MPTHVRLLMTLAPEAAGAATDSEQAEAAEQTEAAEQAEAGEDTHATHVYDIYDTTARRCSTLETVRSALRSLPPATGEERPLRELMHAALQPPRAAGSDTERQPRADVTLPTLGVRMQAVSARGAVLEGVASFTVGDKLLPSRMRAVRAAVSAGGTQLTLVALVHGAGIAGTRPAFHFMGRPSGQLIDLRALSTGKKSVAASGGASHYMRRIGQLQAHVKAMQDVGVAVDVPALTQRAHTPLIDAYMSHAEHEGRALMCVSVFA